MAFEMKILGKNFEAGVPRPLFSVPVQNQLDVGKDGRFLIQVPQAETPHWRPHQRRGQLAVHFEEMTEMPAAANLSSPHSKTLKIPRRT